MTVWNVAAVAIVGAICLITLRRQNGELALLVGIATCVVLLLGVADVLKSVGLLVRELASVAGIENELLRPVLKTAGIAVLIGLTAQICRDAGAGAIALAAELCGVFCALYAALPLIQAVLGLLLELM